jgi:hydroxypyruvate reductase
MAAAAVDVLGARLVAGVVVHPHGAPGGAVGRSWPPAVRLLGAGHPLPDASSVAAGEAVGELLRGARDDERVLLLLSGGASALMELPLAGVSLADLRRTTAALQRAGADIDELNVVRRSLSQLKGGGLARLAAPAPVVTLAISDVVGDRPEAIGSGPSVPSPTGAAEALAVIERRGLAGGVPAVEAVLRAALGAARPPTPALGEYRIVASNRLAAEAAARAAGRRGFRALLVSSHLQGEAREAGKVIGGCAVSVRADRLPLRPPACLVFGGETTVTVRGEGRGGRNQELALGAALALAGCRHAAVLSFATDGVDGPTAAAGAVATGETLARARALGLSPHRALEDNDSERFFRELGDLWVSGPTGTNVNDLAIALVYP